MATSRLEKAATEQSAVQESTRIATAGDMRIKPTNIDRRKCHRVVPVKVLSLGLSRTGTSSMRQAFSDLEYEYVYHYTSLVNENPRDCEMWIEAFRRKFEEGNPFVKDDWDQLLGHCDVISDFPAVIFAKDLLAAYPDAKVVLTVRDSVNVWYKSFYDTIYRYIIEFYGPAGLATRMYRWLLPKTSYDTFVQLCLKHTPIGDIPHKGRDWYESHNAMIRELVPPENLLEFNMKQGWGPLCKFLGKKVPDKPFPHVYDTSEFLQNLEMIRKYQNIVLAVRLAKMAGTLVVLTAIAGFVASRLGHGPFKALRDIALS